ncbi:MAG: hypothetical protein M0Z86_01745, partial [Deltaproteobacteria bacterium]|nr:hypothetical protein [Deltaproteobacteria bacterium]
HKRHAFISSAFKSLSNSIDSSLTFFNTQADRISLMTTKIIERLNKIYSSTCFEKACLFQQKNM